MIRAIYFDGFKTLFRWKKPDPEDMILEHFRLSLSYTEVQQRVMTVHCDAFGHDIERFELRAAQNLGLDGSQRQELSRLLHEAGRRAALEGDAQHVIEELKGRGYRLGLITDIWPHPIADGIIPTSFIRLFDVFSPSYAVGKVKPDPERFLAALHGVNPHEAAMIGDSIEMDIMPAKSLGMTTVLFDPRHEHRNPPADYQVPSLADVLKIFP
ncbi:MAG: HAD family hydrolase [Nanoarchaeota archaeon]